MILRWLSHVYTAILNREIPQAQRKKSHRESEVIFSRNGFSKMCEGIAPFTELKHEAIVYLLGEIEIYRTRIIDVFLPNAITTPCSFIVPAREMAYLMRYTGDMGLKVVGQVHTHPGAAYHSKGDYQGMDIRHPGYVSIVLPVYGSKLPALNAIDVVRFDEKGIWQQIRYLKIE